MKQRTLKKIGLMMLLAIAAPAVTSCSSDDEPETHVIPELEQKLLTGIWISADKEKGDLFTLQFKDDNIVTTNVIHNGTEYFRQLEVTYKVDGNQIILRSPRSDVKVITVQSMDDNQMVVESINLVASGETITNTFVRRKPTKADNIVNTAWKLKTCVPWVEAADEEMTLPGTLTIDGKGELDLVSLPDMLQKIIGASSRLKFNDDSTMAQATANGGSESWRTCPYTLNDYNLVCAETFGTHEAEVSYTLFKSDEGNLIFIYEKNAVLALALNFLMQEAEAQGCDIKGEEWQTLASSLDAKIQRATLLLIFKPEQAS